MDKITETNIKDYIGKEVYVIGSEETVLLRGYRGNGLAQISYFKRFVKGKYPHVTYDCLISNLRSL